MADNDDTPAAAKPPARRAPRKAAAPKSPAATTSSDAPAARKPRKPAASASPAPAEPAAPKKSAAPPKPRSTKRATPPTKRAPKPKESAAPAKAEPKSGGWKNKAAIAGGLAAVGAAATAALLSLRGSTPKKDEAEPEETIVPEASGAHTADGSDASKSFKAGIADEGVVPE